MNRKQVWFFIILALPAALIISACSGLARAEARSSESVIVVGTPQVAGQADHALQRETEMSGHAGLGVGIAVENR